MEFDGLEIVAAVAVALWGIVQGTEWYRINVYLKHGEAVAAVEAAVMAVYTSYVRIRKTSRAPHKLTSDEAATARSMALGNLERANPGAVEALGGQSEACAEIEKAVSRLKAAGRKGKT